MLRRVTVTVPVGHPPTTTDTPSDPRPARAWLHTRRGQITLAVAAAVILLLSLVPVWLIVAVVSGGLIVACLVAAYWRHLLVLAGALAALGLLGVFFAALDAGVSR
jgi:hypothetical protein